MNDVPLMEIERFAIHDGPGIRSVVFLKGCPLHCPWCANPESQRFEPERIVQDGERKWVGRPVSVESVIRVLERDADYYEQSGGGITFSGGEVMAHADVLLCLLEQCKQRGWHTAIETSGHARTADFQSILPYVDLFLFDIKHTDAVTLKEATGADLSLILKNLQTIDPRRVILRLPCIPLYNIEDTHFEQVFSLAKQQGISRIDLLPYHTLGVEKYRQLGRAYPYPVTDSLDPNLLKPFEHQGRAVGLDVRICI